MVQSSAAGPAALPSASTTAGSRELVSEIPGKAEVAYPDREITSVHMNLPTVLWRAVTVLARRYGTTKTNVVVRALNKEAFFARLEDRDPGAEVVILHSDSSREVVRFV